MQNLDDKSGTVMDRLRGSLFLLTFGLGILAFLIAIDRPEWFNLRPASGTAAAMSKASDGGAQDREEPGEAIVNASGRPV